jgi:pimeloyl-ACP methyl ester carboxylesterase
MAGRRARRGAGAWLAIGLLLAGLVALGVQVNRTQLWEDQTVYAGWRLQKHVLTESCQLLDRKNGTRAVGAGGDCAAVLSRARSTGALRPAGDHLVVMLHGLGRSPWLFRRMEAALREAGYEAVAISYPSLTRDVAGHAEHLRRVLDDADGVRRVSFVTHSLGGIVLREALAADSAWRERLELGRVVMLAPPNQGSELALALDDYRLFHLLGGPSAGQMVTGYRYADPPPDLEIGVIAGATPGGRGFNPLLSGNNDGILTVAETPIKGMRDFLVVPALHTVIAGAPETIAATLKFLESGQFR